MPLISTGSSFDREIALLESAGVPVRNSDPIENRFFNEMQSGGAGPEEIVATISSIMNAGENSSVKLAAAKMFLSMYMHPAFVPRREAEQKQMPTINISISGGDVKLQNVLRPADNVIQGEIING